MNKWMRMTTTGLLAAGITVATSYAGVGTASAAELLELKLKKGSTSATINGDKQTIIKPYEADGTMMVQLGLFSRAFGAKVELHDENVIQLTSGKHVISMKIGSKVATVNGKKVTLPAAPVMRLGTLMVPLRPLTEGIGGKMKVISGQIVVTLPASEAQSGSGDSATQHADKTRVGDSKYQWSINYPEDLTYLGGSNATVANFMNTEGTYLLQVAVEPDTVTGSVYTQADSDDLLDELVSYTKSLDETILDQQIVNGSNGTYARVISKTTDGYLSETRLYAGNGYLYFVMYADSQAYSYKDFNENQALLNSFQLSFNSADDKAEDIAEDSDSEESGEVFSNEEYGISVNLPSNWSVSDDSDEATNKDESYAKFGVYSVPAGSTVQNWSQDIRSWFDQNFTTDHYRYIGTTERQIDGHDAVINEMQYMYGNDEWYTEYEVLIQQGDYRYYFEYSGLTENPQTASEFEQMVGSMKVDFETLESNFGHLPLDYYSEDRTKTITRTSTTYGYSLQVPRYWSDAGNDYNATGVSYYYTGGSFYVTIKNSSSLEQAVQDWKSTLTSGGTGSSSTATVSEGQPTTFAGVPAYTFTATFNSDDAPYTGTYTIFTKGKRTFILSSEVNDANNTATHQAEVAKVLSSFNWTAK
ncbi:stalk domain-containing protein [Paenibacillus kandeliae]|uniref:stalk domain-containing protein n=1 Tax=Paenibacillus kandeliae TaxID=3231269 RepID=UPI00345AB790